MMSDTHLSGDAEWTVRCVSLDLGTEGWDGDVSLGVVSICTVFIDEPGWNCQQCEFNREEQGLQDGALGYFNLKRRGKEKEPAKKRESNQSSSKTKKVRCPLKQKKKVC